MWLLCCSCQNLHLRALLVCAFVRIANVRHTLNILLITLMSRDQWCIERFESEWGRICNFLVKLANNIRTKGTVFNISERKSINNIHPLANYVNQLLYKIPFPILDIICFFVFKWLSIESCWWYKALEINNRNSLPAIGVCSRLNQDSVPFFSPTKPLASACSVDESVLATNS